MLLLALPLEVYGLDASHIAVLYNVLDEDSRAIAFYYASRRKIPEHHIVPVSIKSPGRNLDPESFNDLLDGVRDRTSEYVEAYVLAWTLPFRVDCMSITSAFAFGFDTTHCATGCETTAVNPYFDSPSRFPYRDHDVRPAMMLAGRTVQNVKVLIDRGVSSDYTQPISTAYLKDTEDITRSTRASRYAIAVRNVSDRFPVRIIKSDDVPYLFDVMFFFTGAKSVPYLNRLGFLPGALADHLTSAGGVLIGSSQMSILSWIEAGATGSFGAVTEPCNFPQKFPDPALAMMYYLNGETLIEAYWKSVRWPGQGVFVGEPLAKPFAKRPRAD
ncbi:MAG: TIGR03790 family protein [Gammaproteobacteria bacterium]|nr:TIGR03790 family protein [Gammaproteobacteria bacterium]